MPHTEPLTRAQRAALVGQYHARKAFGDLRVWASWYNALTPAERSFVAFYQQVNRPGALERADFEGLPWHVGRSLTVTIKVDASGLQRSFAMVRTALELTQKVETPNFSVLDKAPYATAERLARLRLGATLLAIEFSGHGLPVWLCDALERYTPAILLPDLWWMNQQALKARIRRCIRKTLRPKAES